MSQHDYVIDNASGASVRSDLNNALGAVATLNSGASTPSSPFADQLWVDTANAQIKQRNSANSANLIIGRRNEAYWGLAPHGQCELVKSGANLLLRPKNGNKILVNGVLEAIGSSGVTLAPTALSAGTTYFIYLYNNAGTLTLEAATTGHSTDTSTGVETKTGDATRTLVGMARVIAGPAFVDSDSQRLVRSWFHDRGISGYKYATGGDIAIGSAPWLEISTTSRTEFLAWASEPFRISALASGYDTGGSGGSLYLQTGLDGSQLGIPSIATFPGASYSVNLRAEHASAGLSEGYHYAQTFGGHQSGSAPYYNDEYTGTVISSSGSGA